MTQSEYSSGTYFTDPSRHSEDATFKVSNFLSLLARCDLQRDTSLTSIVDIGCGSGAVIKLVANSLGGNGTITFKGYDVSPHVQHLSDPTVTFVNADFCQSSEVADLALLFDVFEHLTDPISFIKNIGERTRFIASHIPLDYSLNNALRNKFRAKLHNPGHLTFWEPVSALNLLALSGQRIIDYSYTFSFLAPSGRTSLLSKLSLPLKAGLAKLSPWLLSRTLGGASLMVISQSESRM